MMHPLSHGIRVTVSWLAPAVACVSSNADSGSLFGIDRRIAEVNA